MPVEVKFRRGNTSQHSTFTGAEGEITVDTDKDTIVVHDGTTAGGFPLIGANLADNIIPITDNTYSLGNSTFKFADLYLSGNTLFLGDQTITSNASGINFSGAVFANNTEILSSSGAPDLTVTASITVGNSTVNTAISPETIATTGTMTVGNTTINGVLSVGNTAVIGSANITTLSVGNASVSVLEAANTTISGFANITNSLQVGGDAAFGANVSVTGNFIVSGNVTYISSNELDVDDNIIVLNFGLPSNTAPSLDAGIEINRGSAANVSLFWHESLDVWQIFNGTNTFNIATNTDVATAYTNATAFAANADNIASGTLDTARLPSTANVSTAVNVGANVSANTSAIRIGNSTVNSSITQSVLTIANVVATNISGNGASITSVDAATVGGNSALDLRNYTDTAYTNATSFASNADNISSGTLNTARLPSTVNVASQLNVGANVSVTVGELKIGNSTVNSSVSSSQILISNVVATNISGNGASITSVDAATVGGNTASDLQTYASNLAGNAYSNATAFAANADNISSGTLDTARLPSTANVSTAINVGANLNLTVDRINIGNSTINSFITSTSISGNGASITSVNAATVGGNTASDLQTYASNLAGNAYSNATAFAANADNISSGTLNTARLPASINVSTSVAVGSNVIANTTSLKVGNGTTNTIIQKNSISIGNSTVNSSITQSVLTIANVVATNLSGSGSAITNIDANNISTGILNDARLPNTTVVANTYGNSSQIPVLTIDATGRVTNANTVAVAGVSNVVYTESNTTLVISTGDGSSFTTNFGVANSTYSGFIKVVDSTSNSSTDVAASANSVKTAFDAAGNAYSNATSFAANASNISSGTLNTERLPSTANVSTAINVGANVNLTTDRISVGNSTVNSFITATGIETDGSLNVANVVTFANGLAMSNTTISNVADPINARDAANKQYVDSVAEGLFIHEACEVATTDTLATISGNTVTYNNGSSGVGATLTLDSAVTVIDGYTLQTDDRVLVRAETNTAHNGIYVYSNSTVLTRALDFDTNVEIVGGDFTFVINGTLFAKTGHVKVADITTIGTDPIVFEQFSGSGAFTAGEFLYTDGTEFNANASSNNVASVLVARNVDGDFSANNVFLNSANASSFTTSGVTVNTSAVAVGANLIANDSALIVGNTTVNSILTSSSFKVDGASATGNTTITGFINVSSTANVGGVLSARANVVANGQLIVANTASLGNTSVTGFANISSTLDAGNTTITGFANISSTLAAGNTTITGFANISSTLAAGNTTVTGTANVSSAVNIGANVNLSTTQINVGNSTVNSVVSSTFLDLSGNRIKSLSYTSSNTDLQTFDSFATSTYRSAQYNVQLSSGTDYYVINLSLVHDGTTVYLSQYGEIFDNVALGTFDATIASSNVNVQFTPANATTVLKAIVNMIST